MDTFYRDRRVAAFSGFAGTASDKGDQFDAVTRLRDLTRSTDPKKAIENQFLERMKRCQRNRSRISPGARLRSIDARREFR